MTEHLCKTQQKYVLIYALVCYKLQYHWSDLTLVLFKYLQQFYNIVTYHDDGYWLKLSQCIWKFQIHCKVYFNKVKLYYLLIHVINNWVILWYCTLTNTNKGETLQPYRKFLGRGAWFLNRSICCLIVVGFSCILHSQEQILRNNSH